MNGNGPPVYHPPQGGDLLPIREAYEWKHQVYQSDKAEWLGLLASNSWSVWMETFHPSSTIQSDRCLLPIREAYEWKPRYTIGISLVRSACFQFVKRMNGNASSFFSLPTRRHFLASNSWSVWMETHYWLLITNYYLLPIREAYEWKLNTFIDRIRVFWWLASNSWSVWMETRTMPPQLTLIESPCFQFVKRMNGNATAIRSRERSIESCFQFVKRMNGNLNPIPQVLIFTIPRLLPIREAYEWKQFSYSQLLRSFTSLLPIREAYEWKH